MGLTKMKKESKFDKVCIKFNKWYKELNPLLMLLVFTILFHMIPSGLKYTLSLSGGFTLTSKPTLIFVGIIITLCRLLCLGAVLGEFIGNKKALRMGGLRG